MSNKGHPSYPEIILNAKTVFAGKVNEAKVRCFFRVITHLDRYMRLVTLLTLDFGACDSLCGLQEDH